MNVTCYIKYVSHFNVNITAPQAPDSRGPEKSHVKFIAHFWPDSPGPRLGRGDLSGIKEKVFFRVK